MESAFKTIVSVAGVAAACYVLTAAHWIQVLLLFLSVSLGWCVYVCRSDARTAASSRASRRQFFPNYGGAELPSALTASVETPRALDVTGVSAPDDIPAYRFPIHKLSANNFAMPKA